MLIHLQNLVDDSRCYEVVRQLRWPEGVRCPRCQSPAIAKRGFHSQQKARQRYRCRGCEREFDDLSETIFEGHHQPLKVWVLCLYLMGLNLSNEQIATELDLASGDAQAMTSQLRAGVVEKKAS